MRSSDRFKALTADAALRERFLPAMSSSEILAVESLLDPAVDRAKKWCAGWSIFPDHLVVPVMLLTLVQLHHLPVEAVLTRFKNTLWIYALDDRIDNDQLSE